MRRGIRHEGDYGHPGCKRAVAVAAAADEYSTGPKSCDTVAMCNRVKAETITCPETTNGSPTREISMPASRRNFEAEGMGFEPTTP